MGCDVRSELAVNLGAGCDEEGYVLVGEHLETSVRGLYAIGDVAKALNQIAVGFGHAALAAAHIHNALRERAPLNARALELVRRAGPSVGNPVQNLGSRLGR
jgi:thioredoxin reductase (NADPH)